MHTLVCDLVEPELEIQEEQSLCKYGGPQVTIYMDTILALDQGKPWCIPPIILVLSFNHYNYVMLDCALIYRNYDSIVVALWLSF
jgi:hypothetical protein